MKSKNDFFESVYMVVCLIPFGRVSTYGAIANFLGSRGSSRIVGWAMNKSHSYKKQVPAHRVVNKQGLLTGKHHFGGSDTMEKLLENEGIKVINNQIQNFDKLFWDPSLELKMH